MCLLKRTDEVNPFCTRCCFLLLMVLLVHLGIYLFVLTRGGVVEETEQNALYILSERTANRKLYLENEMVQRWSNTEEGETGVYTAMERVLGEAGAQAGQLLTDRELSQRAVDAAIPALVEMLRRNGVTGSFLVLDCPGDEGNYPGFYVRDYDPANYNADNKNLLLERGLPSAARVHNISMDSYWSAFFGFEDQGADSAQFFTGLWRRQGHWGRPGRRADTMPAGREGLLSANWIGKL